MIAYAAEAHEYESAIPPIFGPEASTCELGAFISTDVLFEVAGCVCMAEFQMCVSTSLFPAQSVRLQNVHLQNPARNTFVSSAKSVRLQYKIRLSAV